MTLASVALRRPFTVLVLVLAVLLSAGLALQRMPRDAFPPLGIPTIYVAQPFGGMDPAQMEGYLTYYYEYHFLYITGIEHVESRSIQGAALMKLQFHPGTDMAQAMAETIAYVNRARAFMPAGAVPPFVTRFDAGSVPVGHLVFSTENPSRTVGQMQDAALNSVRPLFATLPGVSAPPPFGGSARTILVNARPERLRAYGFSPDELVTAVAQANAISPSGNLNLGDSYPIVPVNAVVKSIKDLEGVPLRTTAAGAVYLRDVATVEDGSDITTSYALVNGRRTVFIPVTKRADASTLTVVSLVKANLPKFQAVVPEDVKVTFEFDQTPVVWRAIRSLLVEGGVGALLTALMVLVFLRDVRSALVVAVNIPVALLASVTALWLTGQSVNLMTLGGLALAVGVLIDEATVAMENLHTHLADGQPLPLAALEATNETARPRLLAMLCILAVFAPALLMVGPARALYLPLALAVAFSMVASYLLSSTLVPILAVWWLRGRTIVSTPARPSFFRRGYESLLEGALAIRWPLTAFYLLASGLLIWLLLPRLGREIFPSGDSGQFAVRLRATAGTRVEKTEQLALRVLETIKQEVGSEKVALTLGLVGVHAPNYPVNLIHLWNSGPEEAWLAVQLQSGSGVSVEDLREHLRARFAREYPELHFSFEPSDLVSRVMSFGAETPISVAVSGPDLSASRAHAEKILAKLRDLPALRDLQVVQPLDSPTVEVNFDREKAGLLGVKLSDVTRSLIPAATSSRFTAANYWADPKTGVSYNLQVQIPQSQTNSLEDLLDVPVGTGALPEKTRLLRQVASITPGTAPGEYERYNMARVVSLSANFHGTDLGRAVAAVEQKVAEAGAPPAKTQVTVRGQAVPLRELGEGFRSGLLVAIVAIFLLLMAAFQSAALALAVVSTLPAVLSGVALMLWLTGASLNIESGIGAIMALGVAVANAILLVTFAERARRGKVSAREAARLGALSRLRPILMTSTAMCAGMLPLALGLSGGGESAPLGRAVLGGLVFATLATLLLLPPIFVLLRRSAPNHSASLDPTDPASSFHLPEETPALRPMAGVLTLLLALSGAHGQSPAPPPSSVSLPVVSPSLGEITRYVRLPATIRADREVTLYAKVSGYLKSVEADMGQRVQSGELLAELEVPELIAEQKRLEAEAKLAGLESNRLGEAQKKAPDLVTPQALDKARGTLEAANASMQRTEALLSFARITAPFAGIVTARLLDAGAYVPAATAGGASGAAALFTMVDASTVRVRVMVPEAEVPLVQIGQPAQISLEELPGKSFAGTVTRLGFALDLNLRAMPVEIDLANTEGALRPGMYAIARLGVQKHEQAIRLPVEALVMEKTAAFVFKFVNGLARKTPVTVGFNDGTQFEILTGFKEGEEAIVPGKATLIDGQPVQRLKTP